VRQTIHVRAPLEQSGRCCLFLPKVKLSTASLYDSASSQLSTKVPEVQVYPPTGKRRVSQKGKVTVEIVRVNLNDSILPRLRGRFQIRLALM
jgi:hypothetical protein